MSQTDVIVPSNVRRFEIAAYLSLMIDTVSAGFQALGADNSDQTNGAVNIINALFILAFVFLVGLAARKRKNWARMVLLAALLLAVVSLLATLSQDGPQMTTGLDIISVALTGYSLYQSFTGDARGWFTG